MIKHVKSDWYGACYIAESDSAHSKGVAIMILPRVDQKFIKSIELDNGRLLMCIIAYNNVFFTLVSVYSPSIYKGKLSFMQKFKH